MFDSVANRLPSHGADGDNKASTFLIQKIAIDVQQGNAASVMATIPSSQDWAEFISLPTIC